MSDVCLPLILEILIRRGLCQTSTDCEVFYPCPIVGNASETAQCFTKTVYLEEKKFQIYFLQKKAESQIYLI